MLGFYVFLLLKIIRCKCSKPRLLFYYKQNCLIGNQICSFCYTHVKPLNRRKCLFSIKYCWWSDKFDAFWDDYIWPITYTSDSVQTSVFPSPVLLWRKGPKTWLTLRKWRMCFPYLNKYNFTVKSSNNAGFYFR